MVTFVEVLFVMLIPAPALSVYLLAVMELMAAESAAICADQPETALLYTKLELQEEIALLSALAVTVFQVALLALMDDFGVIAETVFHVELCAEMEDLGTIALTVFHVELWAEMEDLGTIAETVFQVALCAEIEDFGTIADTVFQVEDCAEMELFGTYPARD